MADPQTVRCYGNFDVIGPVQLPLYIDQTQTAEFTSNYFELPRARYNVLTLGDIHRPGIGPLVRIQSKCIWGIEFGSAYCDCRWQLEESKRLINAESGGVIIYCHDDTGKGVGTRFHNLVYAEGQREKLELVVDAYTSLGLDEDYRDYRDIAHILKHLGVTSVRLLTNSPQRIDQLRGYGFTVEHVPLQSPLNPHLEEEYVTKRMKLGHLLRWPDEH